MLFSSGVGYFEHAGTVRGNGATELRFKTTQINDILKSLVLQDQDGGRVGDDHLSVAGSDREDAPELSGRHHAESRAWPICSISCAARSVTIQSQAERMTGTILGVETRQKPAEKGEAVDVAGAQPARAARASAPSSCRRSATSRSTIRSCRTN